MIERLTLPKYARELIAAAILALVPSAVAVAAFQSSIQTTPDEPATFEVASVKANKDGQFFRISVQPGGRMLVVNVPLKTLVEHAYAVRGSRLIGGPGWIASDRFDINAKSPESAPAGMPQLFAMLRALLQDRFGLRVHTETRELTVLELMLLRDDRKVGPQLQPSTVDCGGYVPGIDQGLKAFNGARCAIFYSRTAAAAAKLMVKGRSMTQFASDLEILSGRPVVDGTGLRGMFDVDLNVDVDQLPGIRTESAASTLPDGPSLATALREQLGLTLQSRRRPVQALIIDSVHQPTPD